MRVHPKYIQLVGDAVIPLAGFFLWEWSLYFILLFYFLDVLANEVIMHLKSEKIIGYQGKPTKTIWATWGLISVVALILALLLVHLAVLTVFPSINFWMEIRSFWTYKELGIQQGYLLFPIVALGAYQQYRLFFLTPARQRTADFRKLWKKHLSAFLFVGIAAGLTIIISQAIILPEVLYVGLIVVGIAAYRFFFSTHSSDI